MPDNSALNSEAGQRDHSNDLFLVDGSGFIFRAYFALPPLTRSDGTPVNAVLGFTNMLAKLLTDLHAPRLAVIFDAARKNFRNDIYPEYKANREDAPEDLIPQFPLIRQSAEAFGLPVMELEGFEADDLIATYTKLALEQGLNVTIVSSDKDLLQLVGPRVSLFDPIKYSFQGAEAAEKKFGVSPDKVVDVQALAGDKVDNVPGIPGIGVKTAAQLITEYGDLETLLARAEEIKQPKRRESLVEHAEAARISKKLVMLDQNVDVPIGIDGLEVKEPDHARLRGFLEEMEFRTLVNRLGGMLNGGHVVDGEEGEATTAAAPEKAEYVCIEDEKTLKKWVAEATAAGVVAVDTETTSLTPADASLVGVSMSYAPGKAAYIPLGHTGGAPEGQLALGDAGAEGLVDGQIAMDKALAILKPMLEDDAVLKIGQNIKYDWQIFAKHGIDVGPFDDTMVLSYVLDGSKHGHGMDELSETFLGHTTIKYSEVAGKGKSQVTFDRVAIETAVDYAAEDADMTLRLHGVFKPRLVPERMASVYERLDRPLIRVLAQMELTGIKVDPDVLRRMSNDFAVRLGELEAEIHKMAGHSFNIGSPKQIGEVLFDGMGLEGGKKTKTGAWSTSADVLENLAAQGHEIVQRILDWRQVSKLKSTYTDALPLQISKDTGRIHTSFSMTVANTGRLASSDPNLQNIPIRTEEGRKIRTAFIAEDGCVLLSADYSQVELRLVAEMAGVKALQKAFHDGIDIHAHTASQVFDVPLDEMTPEVRRKAKAVNFGIIYGISGFGLAKQLGCSPKEAQEYIDRYLERLPEINAYMEAQKEYARKHGYIKTIFGRKCMISGIKDKNYNIRQFAERQAINAPLQGTAADIMKRAMINMQPALDKAGLKAKMLLQVHDELIFEVPKDELEETEKLVKQVMEEAAPEGMSVPLLAEAGHAHNWADAH